MLELFLLKTSETNALLSKDPEKTSGLQTATLQRTPELPAVKRELRSRPDVGMSMEVFRPSLIHISIVLYFFMALMLIQMC